MVYWITGRAGSGKSTLADRIAKQVNGVVIDGDEFRAKHYPTLGYTDKDNEVNVLRIAQAALEVEESGRIAIVACISPKRKWRENAQKMFKECVEICLPFGTMWPGTTYEETEVE